MTTSTIDVEELKQLSQLSSYLDDNNAPLKRKRYGALGASEWELWINTLNSENITITSVLPYNGTIKNITEHLLESSDTLNSETLGVLLKTIHLTPLSVEWKSVAEDLVLWANSTTRELENNDAYILMLKIYSLCNKDASSLIEECVKESDFWACGSKENISAVYTLPLLAACIIKSSLQNNEYVSSDVKEYWKQESANDNIEEEKLIFNTLKTANKVSVIWDLTKDINNNLAISVIRHNKNDSDLYEIQNGLAGLQNYRWVNKNDKEIINNLCNHGDLKKLKDLIDSNPLNYDYGLYTLISHGNTEAHNLAVETIQSLNKEQWIQSLLKNNYILDCVMQEGVSVDHRYTDAFTEHFISTMTKDITNEWIWNNFDELQNWPPKLGQPDKCIFC